MQFEYSVLGVQERLRREYWYEVVSKHLIPCQSEIDVERDSLFYGRFAGQAVGSLTVAHTQASPKRTWLRGARDIKSKPDDDFLVTFVAEGSAKMRQGNRDTVLQAGDFAFYDAGLPFEHRYQAESTYGIRVPRELMLSMIPNAALVTNLAIRHSNPVAGLLGALAVQCSALDPGAPSSAKSRLATSFLDLLTAAVELEFGVADHRDNCERDIFKKACRFIESELGNAELTADSISAAMHVSSRTLSRAFARNNNTVMRYLWQRRLEVCHEILARGQVSSVHEAAYNCGFGDMSHFGRLFKAHFSVTPGSVLSRKTHLVS